MAHKACHDVGTWVSSNIQQQVEQCIDRDCIWWCLCCNKWFCFLVWVVVAVVTWVIQTVCEIVADVVELITNIVKGLVDIIAGIFTWDWSRIVAGLGEIVGGVIAFVAELIPIATLGTLYGAFEENRNVWRLRNFANGLLQDRYGSSDPEGFRRMKDALGIDSGGFGLRLQCTAKRLFIRSDFSSQADGTPDLIVWLRQTGIDLKSLAGFNPPEWWNREWPELVGDAGDVSDADLDIYVSNGGRGEVKHFTLFSMSSGDMQTRLDTATQHATEIGLILQWTIQDVQIKSPDQILINTDNFPPLLLEDPFFRHDKNRNMTEATNELCMPIAIGAFGFQGSASNGISSPFADADCLDQSSGPLTGSGITGCAFRYRRPDIAFKYVTIHELGHTFGLCHVDGLLRIMYTANRKSIWSLSSLKQYWTSGLEAGLVFEEAERVWAYIVRNFSPACLETRQF